MLHGTYAIVIILEVTNKSFWQHNTSDLNVNLSPIPRKTANWKLEALGTRCLIAAGRFQSCDCGQVTSAQGVRSSNIADTYSHYTLHPSREDNIERGFWKYIILSICKNKFICSQWDMLETSVSVPCWFPRHFLFIFLVLGISCSFDIISCYPSIHIGLTANLVRSLAHLL